MIGTQKRMIKNKSLKKLNYHFLSQSRVGLWLTDYDDIFSDFDHRPYSQRSLGDDFMTALKKGCKDKVDLPIEIEFIIPNKKKSLRNERIIIRRLKKHFTKHHNFHKIEKKKILVHGLSLVACGILLMFVLGFFFFGSKDTNLLVNVLILILEPGGWFLLWEGLELVVHGYKEKHKDFKYYKKLTSAKMLFIHT